MKKPWLMTSYDCVERDSMNELLVGRPSMKAATPWPKRPVELPDCRVYVLSKRNWPPRKPSLTSFWRRLRQS